MLCGALSEAIEDLDLLSLFLIDFSIFMDAECVTLTHDFPVFLYNQELLVQELLNTSLKTRDLLWKLPFYMPYHNYLRSELADFTNSSLKLHG